MNAAAALYAQLNGDTGVTTAASGRIFPELSPEVGKAYPCVVYAGDAAEAESAYDGKVGMATQKIRVTCQAMTYTAADDLANKCTTALADKSGTWGGIVVQGCFFEDRAEATTTLEGMADDATLYIIDLQFSIVFLY